MGIGYLHNGILGPKYVAQIYLWATLKQKEIHLDIILLIIGTYPGCGGLSSVT